MSGISLDHAMSFGLWITVKASILLVVVALLQGVMYRRMSAATRHLVWTLTIVGVVLLPILSFALPEWAAVVRTVPMEATDAMAENPEDLGGSAGSLGSLGSAGSLDSWGSSGSWATLIVSAYTTGVLIMLIFAAIQGRSVRRLARAATDVRDEEWTRLLSECAATMDIQRLVRLLRTRERSMPMAFGTHCPTILIPATADTWPADRRRAVILHEMAHVARFDCLTQTLAFVACTMYWFHPVTWWVARRLRIERELACDDRVIAAGAQAREYAGHLLEIAYTLGSHRAPALAVGMARSRQLEGRLLAVLDETRNRSLPAVRVRVAGAGIATALLLAVASATSTVVALQPDADRAPAVEATQQQTGISQDRLPGTWEIRPTTTEGVVHLRLTEANSSSGLNLPIQRLEGLATAQLTGAGGPVNFRVRRDAGTFTFEGVFRGGVGAGTFSFTPDSNFPAELAKRGFARPTAVEQYQLARHDIGYAFLDELNKQAYAKPQTSELVRAGQHGVNVAFVHDMAELGYRLGSLAPLITLRDHGVTPSYVRELADQGYKGLSAENLRRARDHGISPEYVRAMRAAGYTSLTMEQLINARDHGVNAEFVRELDAAGHAKLPLDQLIRVRDHGVSADFAREMRQLGYVVTIEELVRARDHGVTPKYAQELKALGYDRLAIEDLVTLRDHGLTPDRIRAANARARTRLPVDMLKSFAAGGFR